MGSILVIDDEKSILDIIKAALSAFGYDVEIAVDGLEGIKKFEERVYDLVITDLIMPNLDGNGVVEHIRSSNRGQTPIIGISGTPWLLKQLDVDTILPKPFPIHDLIRSVKTLSAVTAN